MRIVNKQLFINDQQVDDASYAVHKDPDTYRTPRDFTEWINVSWCRKVTSSASATTGTARMTRAIGLRPARERQGRALLIYWSNGGETPDGTWVSWQHRLRQLGGTVVGFPTKTRWSPLSN